MSQIDRPVLRLLRALACFGLLALGLVVAIDLLLPGATTYVRSSTAYLLAAVGAIWLDVRLTPGARWSEAPLAPRRAWLELPAGLLAGGGLVALMAAVFAAASWYRVEGVSPWPGLGPVLSAFALVGLNVAFQEAFDRGLLFPRLEAAFGLWPAVVLDLLLFSAVHLSNASTAWWQALVLGVGAGSLYLAAFVLTRRLWLPIGLHLGWNYALAIGFGFPLSGHEPRADAWIRASVDGPTAMTGGAFGPEAGLVGFLAQVAAAAGLVWLARRRARQLDARAGEVPGAGGPDVAAS